MAARLTATRAVALIKTVQASPPVPAAVTSRLAPPPPPAPAPASRLLLDDDFASRRCCRVTPSDAVAPLALARGALASLQRLHVLGRGGQGVVHEVVAPAAPGDAGRARFALKRVRVASAASAALREARIMARLAAHANVLGFYASWLDEAESESEEEPSDDELDVLLSSRDASVSASSDAAELSSGGVVSSAAARRSTLNLLLELAAGDLALRLGAGPLRREERGAVRGGIAAGLAHLHAHAVAHRDLKPANVLCARGGSIWKIADFGLALEEAEALRARADCGTHIYSDPALGVALSGARRDAAPLASVWRALLAADMYAVGIVMLEIAHPFATAMERATVLGAHRAHGALPRALSTADEALVRWLTRRLAPERPSAAILATHFGTETAAPSAQS